MKNILKSGICAVLIGASGILSSESITTPKNNLEIIASQGSFISPDRNYSLGRSPADFGFVLKNHEVPSNDSYRDQYLGQHGWNIIEGMEQEGNLQTLYDDYSIGMCKSVSDLLVSHLKNGEMVRLVGGGTPKSIVVDNNPALTSTNELWLTSADMKDFATKKDIAYSQKYTLRMTLVRAQHKVYAFTMFYQQINKPQDAQANASYDDVLNSFHALK